MGSWFVGLGDAAGVDPHTTRAVVPMGSLVWLGTAPVMGACEVLVVGLGLGEVGVGLGLGLVVGLGLGEVGDGDGLLCGAELGPSHGAVDASALLCPAEVWDEAVPEVP